MIAYILQGLLIGFAVLAPIGMQNLFVINTALVHSIPRIIATVLIVDFFDLTMSIAAFYGLGAVFEYWPPLKGIMLLLGGALIVYMGYKVFNTEPTVSHVDTNVSISKIIWTAFVVSWLNPQAIIDVTMMFGALKASIPDEMDLPFLSGYVIATFIWFFGLSAVMHTLAKRIKISQLVWINRICGIVLFIYGMKLFIEGVCLYI